MILHDDQTFTIESDDPEARQVIARTVAPVFQKYWLVGTKRGDSICLCIDGVHYLIRPKLLDS